MAVAHYLEALTWQRDVAKLHTIFGGKSPHPNFLVGGVASPIDLNSDSAINTKKLMQVQDVINEMRTFVDQVYVPIPWRWPPSTRTGSREGRGWATSCAMETCRPPV